MFEISEVATEAFWTGTWALAPNWMNLRWSLKKQHPLEAFGHVEKREFSLRAKLILYFEARYHIPSRPARCVHPPVVVEAYSPPWSLKTSWAIQSVRRVRWSLEGSFGSPFLWTLDQMYQMDQAWQHDGVSSNLEDTSGPSIVGCKLQWDPWIR